MLKRSIYNCCISLLALLISLPITAQYSQNQYGQQSGFGQNNQYNNQQGGAFDNEDDEERYRKRDTIRIDSIPVFNRALVGVDLFEPFATLFGQSFFSTGISFSVDMKDKFIPTLEFGIASSDRKTNNGVQVKSTQGYYGRVGLDVKMLGNTDIGFLSVGFRYGVSSTTYDINNFHVSNGYWGEEITDRSLKGLKASAGWLELVAGARARVAGKVVMGWSLRYRFLLNETFGENGKPFHIPGYGPYASSSVGIAYTIYYQMPFKSSKKPMRRIRIKQPEDNF